MHQGLQYFLLRHQFLDQVSSKLRFYGLRRSSSTPEGREGEEGTKRKRKTMERAARDQCKLLSIVRNGASAC